MKLCYLNAEGLFSSNSENHCTINLCCISLDTIFALLHHTSVSSNIWLNTFIIMGFQIFYYYKKKPINISSKNKELRLRQTSPFRSTDIQLGTGNFYGLSKQELSVVKGALFHVL